MAEIVKEKDGVKLLKDYSSRWDTNTNSGYLYWVEGQEENKVGSYFDALELFQEVVAVMLEPLDGDCPRCGGELRSIGRGRGRMKRYARVCARCSYEEDEMDAARQRQILEQAGAIKRDVPDHREGRVGVKEFLQGNEEGFDPRFD